jgi:hypothetical protein
MRPYRKNGQHKKKRTGRVAQVVECLSSKRETLSSNPSIIKKKKKGKEIFAMLIKELMTTTHREDVMMSCPAILNIFRNVLLILGILIFW